MDFRGRGTQVPPTQTVNPSASSVHAAGGNQGKKFSQGRASKLLQLGSVALLFAITILVVAITFLLYFGGNDQQKAVQKDKFQAVFLNNGQVYFGNIKGLSSKSIDFQNIYYLQTNGTGTEAQTNAAANVSLVKLGCELHAPYDQMLINNDQVIFWENLQDSSQVVKAITEYKKQNPKQACSQQSQSSTQQAPSTTPTTTTPTTTTPTRRP